MYKGREKNTSRRVTLKLATENNEPSKKKKSLMNECFVFGSTLFFTAEKST